MATDKTHLGINTWIIGAASLAFYAMSVSQGNAAMANVICTILNIVQGALGNAAATMGVLAVAIGATLGKMSWGLAITVAVGISLIFQAAIYASYFGIASPC